MKINIIFRKTPAFILFINLLFVSSCSDEEPSVNLAPQNGDFNLEMLSQTALPFEGGFVTDVFGYFDEESGKEYAIVGHVNQGGNVAVIEVSADGSTQIVSTIEDAQGFDVKVWRHYLYIGNGGPTGNFADKSLIYDISNPERPMQIGDLPPSHNLTISDNGFLILSGTVSGSGMVIMDLNSDPANPEVVWTDSRSSDSHDASVIGNRLYDFHSDETVIYDFSDPTNPIELGVIDDERIGYHHSGWATEDGNFLIIADEGFTALELAADLTIWDISDPSQATKVAEISDLESLSHNVYLKDNLAFVSYYASGFKLFDFSNPASPELLGQFDTTLENEINLDQAFRGAFGVYPFTELGHIYISDMVNGLLVLEYKP